MTFRADRIESKWVQNMGPQLNIYTVSYLVEKISIAWVLDGIVAENENETQNRTGTFCTSTSSRHTL